MRIQNKIEKIVVVVYLLVFVVLLAIDILALIFKFNISVSGLLYWQITIAVVYLISRYKVSSGTCLKTALVLFVPGSVFTVVGLPSIAETLMKISLIFWLIGLIMALVEYRNNNLLPAIYNLPAMEYKKLLQIKNFYSAFFILGVLFLLVSSFVALFGHFGFESKIISFSFWFFAAGLTLYVIDIKKNER
jgi:hypothetical protein